MPTADELLNEARQQLGKRYVFGADGPNTFDCSGLVTYVFGKYSIHLPHFTGDLVKRGRSVSKNDIQPGDLVFFNWGGGPNSHVGIAVSKNQVIDAPNSRSVVRYHDISNSWYGNRITAVRRIPNVTQGPTGGLTPNGTANGNSASAGAGDQGTTGGATAGGGAAGSDQGAVDGLKQAIKDAFAPLSGLETLAQLGMRAFMPSTIVRIVCGIAGLVFIGWGTIILARETSAA